MRKKTGAPLLDIKKALTATGFNFESALDELRRRGLAATRRSQGRTATEGLVGIKVSDCGRFAAVVEVNAETDFVSRTKTFQELVRSALDAVITAKSSWESLANSEGGISLDKLEALPTSASQLLGEAVSVTAARLRENVCLRRAYVMTARNSEKAEKDEFIGYYLHGQITPDLGRQVALVKLKGFSAQASFTLDISSKLAMHIVAARPGFLKPCHVSDAVVAREADIIRERPEHKTKSPKLVQTIVEGQLAKFYSENCLVKQKFVMDSSTTVADWLERAHGGLDVVRFVRVKLGEGIDAKSKDFAAVVAATATET